jgi:hypothetical protein
MLDVRYAVLPPPNEPYMDTLMRLVCFGGGLVSSSGFTVGHSRNAAAVKDSLPDRQRKQHCADEQRR